MRSKHNRHHRRKISLLILNGALVFALAFIVGGQFARAQSGDAQADNYLNGSGDGSEGYAPPATAQYPEFKDQLDTTVTPEIPKPGEQTTITVNAYSFDINSALITWKVNGKVIQQDLGAKKFVFQAGLAGQTNVVDLTVAPSDRPSISQKFTFATGDVDLLWQSNVYVPPFYKGKALYTPEASLIFVAMPRTSSGVINPKNIVFNWKIDYEADAENSGFGRNSYTYNGPIIVQPVDVSVDTYEANSGKAAAVADMTVENDFPIALFYENHPLYGLLFNRSLEGSITAKKSELGLSAYPYFQSVLNKNSGPTYSWDVDTYGVDIPANQNTITLRKNSDSDIGRSAVRVQLDNLNKILQSTATGLVIDFDTTPSTPAL